MKSGPMNSFLLYLGFTYAPNIPPMKVLKDQSRAMILAYLTISIIDR